MRVVLFAAAAAVSLSLATSAAAQDLDANIDTCNNAEAPVAKEMAACTALIESGSLSPVNLAAAYFNRGKTNAQQKDYAGAVADYSEAIRLNPQGASAFESRGIIYAKQNDYDRAIADFSAAISVDPKDADALYYRSLAEKFTGRKAESDADLARAKAIDPDVDK